MFGAPWWLLGTIAGAAPLIIHLLNKHRFKRVTWAAMEWLLRALERNRRRMRVENLILLIVRTMILVLLALALARPILRAGAMILGEGSHTARIFVLDNSYSMGVEQDGTTPLDSAKRIIQQVLEKSRKGDSAALVVTGEESAETIPEPDDKLELIRDRLTGVGTEGVTLSNRDADLSEVLARVAEAAAELEQPRVEIYVFTDMQRAAWFEEDRLRSRKLAEAVEAVKEHAGFYVVDCSKDESANTAVTRIALNAEGSDDEQSLVAVGTPMVVRATLTHYAPEGRGDVSVRLLIDDQTEGETTVSLEARKPAVAQFRNVVFKESGVHVVRIEIDADDLKLDDTRSLAVEAEREIKVLCVNGAPSVDPVSNETYYLERALAPQQFAYSEGTSVFSVETVSQVEFLNRNLAPYRLVVLANVYRVNPVNAEASAETEAGENAPRGKVAALEAFVKGGGALLIFAGDRLEPDAWNRQLYRDGQGCLPARILERKVLPVGDPGYLRFNVAESTHPVIRTLTARGFDMTPSRIFGWFYLEPDEKDERVRVLCRYNDEAATPAMVEKTFGQGRVVLIGTSATMKWNTFPLIFPPFVQELASYLVSGGAGRRNVTVGEPLTALLFPDEFKPPVSVVDPAGNRSEIGPDPEGDAFRFSYDDTDLAGSYKVTFDGTRGATEYVARLDTRESDLEKIEPDRLQKALGDDAVQFVPGVEELQAAIRRSELGASLWRPVIIAVLALCLVESLLATVFGNRRGVVTKG